MRQESGRSMIEMLGVLTIMGVLTVGAIGMISTAMRTQKRNAVNDEVIQMTTQVRTLLGEYDDFSHINNSLIPWTAEFNGQVFLLHNKRTVYNHITAA